LKYPYFDAGICRQASPPLVVCKEYDSEVGDVLKTCVRLFGTVGFENTIEATGVPAITNVIDSITEAIIKLIF
jgi:hypothetical protein